MTPPLTTQDMLPSEATFLAAMQRIGFGRFDYLQIRGGELVLDPWPATVRDVKYATPPNPGKPAEPNSELRPQVAEFFADVREVDTGEIRELEVRQLSRISPGGRRMRLFAATGWASTSARMLRASSS
jgi:hypothetical protein